MTTERGGMRVALGPGVGGHRQLESIAFVEFIKCPHAAMRKVRQASARRRDGEAAGFRLLSHTGPHKRPSPPDRNDQAGGKPTDDRRPDMVRQGATS
jgi:hypothetical protein